MTHVFASYWAVLSYGTVYYAVQSGSNFWVWGWNPKVWLFKWKLLSNTFLFTTRCKLVLTSLKSSLCIKRFRRFFGMFDEELFEFWPREHWTNFHEGKSEKKASKVPKGLRKSLAGRRMKFVSNFYQVKINWNYIEALKWKEVKSKLVTTWWQSFLMKY